MPFQNPPANNPSIFSPSKFFQPQISQAAQFQFFSEEDGDWIASQLEFAAIAQAATQAATSLSTAQARQVFSWQQDELAVVLDDTPWVQVQPTLNAPVPSVWILQGQGSSASGSYQLDEDYWNNPTAPAVAALYQTLPYLFDTQDIVPQPAQPIQDEDFWQNPVAPLALTLTWVQPWAFDQPEQFFQPDEDYWQNPAAPVWFTLQWVQQFNFDPVETVPQPVVFGPEEDLWLQLVSPTWATHLWPLQHNFDIQEPAGSLSGQPDEDYWIFSFGPPLYVMLVNKYPQPFNWDDLTGFTPPIPPGFTGRPTRLGYAMPAFR